MEQRIITSEQNYKQFDEWVKHVNAKNILRVCDSSIEFQKNLNQHLKEVKDVRITDFMDFQPNPLYKSVVKGVKIFHDENCDAIMAVGGGSAMDVAKCIKLYSNMDSGKSYLEQEIVVNNIPFLAIPTTAGTGSEATRYAVIYYEGKKQSVTHESCIPGTVLMDPHALRSLPMYQRKSTMMDALCHAIESFWSVNSNDESKEYSRQSIQLIMESIDGYLENTEQGNRGMLMAAHLAGKAINIAQTTAGHAMCYKITSLFRISHGHAAALCDRMLFPWMLKNTDKCIDSRGEEYLRNVFDEIAHSMGCDSPERATERFLRIFEKLHMSIPQATDKQYEELKNSINQERLKNHPIKLDAKTVDRLYHQILKNR